MSLNHGQNVISGWFTGQTDCHVYMNCPLAVLQKAYEYMNILVIHSLALLERWWKKVANIFYKQLSGHYIHYACVQKGSPAVGESDVSRTVTSQSEHLAVEKNVPSRFYKCSMVAIYYTEYFNFRYKS